jgi:hypothetical protein
MSECRYNGRTEPRTVPGRHDGACQDEACPGCAPCHRAHCRVCGIAHDAGTCAECMAETREALREIARLVGSLPEEVEHRGVQGEAMMLLGPATDPERRGHLEASVLAGRIPWEAIDTAHKRGCDNPKCIGCLGEVHPDFVLRSWQMVYRDALDHDEAPDAELHTAVDYLDTNLGYFGTYDLVPFSEFAADLRRCHVHLEAVLHDSDRGVRANVPCFDCHGELERPLGKTGFADTYTCRVCRRVYTIAEYNFALRAALEGQSA